MSLAINRIDKYKEFEYNPEDYEGIFYLSEDLSSFYDLINKYYTQKTITNFLTLDQQREVLFFTIKHRELEGAISHRTAQDLREYMTELFYD